MGLYNPQLSTLIAIFFREDLSERGVGGMTSGELGSGISTTTQKLFEHLYLAATRAPVLSSSYNVERKHFLELRSTYGNHTLRRYNIRRFCVHSIFSIAYVK